MTLISLDYGKSERFCCDLPVERLWHVHQGPSAVADPLAVVQEGLRHPLEFPALELALVPDDRVVIVLDRAVPSAAELISAAWSSIALAGVSPENVLILQPASAMASRPPDPRLKLPADIRERIVWKIHDPTVVDGTGYLASSAAGERLYLSRELLDADFVLPIGRFGFDAMLGRRELTSAFYPGLSNPEAFTKAIGQGHSELGPDDERPLRQLVHEVAWLLGIQFAIQVLPSRGHGGLAGVLIGNTDRVVEQGKSLLDSNWRVTLEQRGETVIAAIPRSGDETTWEDLGAAVDAARKLIVQGGRIIVLSDLACPPGPGFDLLRSSRSAKAALQPIRKLAPPDVQTASQIAAAADWASVYLLSRIEGQIIEEAFMTPLSDEREVTRLLATCDACIVLPGAQHIYAEIQE